jgi:hypothetical protein
MACEIMLYQIRIVECCLLLVEVGKISEQCVELTDPIKC